MLKNKLYHTRRALVCLFFLAIIPVAAQQPAIPVDAEAARTQSGVTADSTDGFQQIAGLSATIRKLSLQECIQLALQNNRSLQVYRLSNRSEQIKLEQAESRFLPSGYLNANRGDNRNDDLGYVIAKTAYKTNIGLSRALETGGSLSVGVASGISESSANPGITNYSTDIGISLSHPILRGAGLTVNKIPIWNQQYQAQISMMQIKVNLIAIITNIENRYWDLILVYEDLIIQQDAQQRSNDLLATNKSLIEAGRMASQEIVQAQSDVASRQISVANAENSIINTQIDMLAYLDLSERITIQPTTQMSFTPIEVNVDTCKNLAFTYRPDWQIQNLKLKIKHNNLVVADNNRRYQLNTSGGISSNGSSTSDLQSTYGQAIAFSTLNWNIGFSFTVPFNKKVLNNGYELQKLAHDQELIHTAELRDNIEIWTENSVRTVKHTLKQVQLAQRARVLTAKKLGLEEEKMKVGRSTNFQVISYQRDLTTAQNNELKATANYLKALGRLEKTMGTTLIKWDITLATE